MSDKILLIIVSNFKIELSSFHHSITTVKKIRINKAGPKNNLFTAYVPNFLIHFNQKVG